MTKIPILATKGTIVHKSLREDAPHHQFANGNQMKINELNVFGICAFL